MLKIGEAAKKLGVSKDTLRRWEKSGKLKSFRSPSGYRTYNEVELETITVGDKTSPAIIPNTSKLLTKFLFSSAVLSVISLISFISWITSSYFIRSDNTELYP